MSNGSEWEPLGGGYIAVGRYMYRDASNTEKAAFYIPEVARWSDVKESTYRTPRTEVWFKGCGDETWIVAMTYAEFQAMMIQANSEKAAAAS